MVPNEDRLAALNAKSVDFIDQRGAHCIQENGQRKYGGPPPGWEGPPPPKGTEVHVSELPQDCFEFELIPLFEKVGRIYETRLMMEFNSYNKGYCFIRYSTVAEAKMAISVFNDYEIRPGHRISVAISVDNCRLFLGGIPNDKTREEVMQLLANSVSGLKDVILYKNVSNRKKNRGFCFLEFHNHRQAAIARRHMIPEKVGYWGRHLIVDWAEPEPDFIEDDELVKMTDLYVRNLADDTTEERLKQIVANIVPLQYVTRIKKVKDFAFVHFSCKNAADKVLQELDGRVIDGEVVSVVWKRPSKESRENWLSRIKYNSRPKRNLTSQRLPDKHLLNEIYQQQLQLASSPRSTASDELNNNKRSPLKSSSCEKHDSSKLNYDVNLTERRKKKTKPSNLALNNVKCTACAMNGVSPSLDTNFSYLTLGSNMNDALSYENSWKGNSENYFGNGHATQYNNNMNFDYILPPTPAPSGQNGRSRFQFPNSSAGMCCSLDTANSYTSSLFLPASPSLNQQNQFTFPLSPNPNQSLLSMSQQQTHPLTYLQNSQPWPRDNFSRSSTFM